MAQKLSCQITVVDWSTVWHTHTVWSQTHSLRHQFDKDTIWRDKVCYFNSNIMDHLLGRCCTATNQSAQWPGWRLILLTFTSQGLPRFVHWLNKRFNSPVLDWSMAGTTSSIKIERESVESKRSKTLWETCHCKETVSSGEEQFGSKVVTHLTQFFMQQLL